MDDISVNAPKPSSQRRWWPLVKWSLFAVVLFFVGQRAVALWRSSPPTELHVDVTWLIPASLLYLIAWLPSVWFWRALLMRMEQQLDWRNAIRAYYVGHMGKYIPGKALVLVIRGALAKDAGTNPVLGGLTAAYETLVAMAAGAAIAVGLAPLVVGDGLWQQMPSALRVLREQTWLVPLVVMIATFASTPVSAWLFTRVGRKALPRTDDALPTSAITAGLVSQGVLITSLGWLCIALSLGCTLQAISGSQFDLAHFPIWLVSVTLSTFLGFVVLIAPGGLGIREWVLIEILKDQPAIGAERAILAAGLLRAVWFVTELIAAGLLYVFRPARNSENTSSADGKT
jgi:glycosyltransferase 2 family protein